MKKSVLTAILLCASILIFAQTSVPKIKQGLKTLKSANKTMPLVEALKQKPAAAVPAFTPPEFRDPQGVSVIPIGTSGNAYSYGYAGGQRSMLSYNQDLNVLINMHRMGGLLDPGGAGGDLGYDVSYDGGLSWTTMVETFLRIELIGSWFIISARFPQAAITNPPGNTNPENARLAFFAPLLDGSNGSWGGYGYGTHKFGSPSLTDTTRNIRTSSGNIYQYLPSGMDYSRSQNCILVTDINTKWPEGTNHNYQDQLIINRGVWNEIAGDFLYHATLLDAPIIDHDIAQIPECVRTAFAPDGETAYIVMLGNNGMNENAVEGQKSFYPIVWKSTDAGESWSASKNIQLDGSNGIPQIMNYLTDQEIADLFEGSNPPRDEIPYTTAFDFDLVVDANGNPHIAVGIGVQGEEDYSIVAENPYYAIFDIWSPDGGDTWQAVELGRPASMRGYFGEDGVYEDSRVCAATDWPGSKVFFSWLDTDPELNAEGNIYPDVWTRAFDPAAQKLSANALGEDKPTNVTYGSEAMWRAYFATMSNYVITHDDAYILPIVYEEMNPDDLASNVQYKYIQDFSFTDDDFTIPTGTNDLIANFTSDSTVIFLGSSVHFTDRSLGGAIEWYWEFEGGNPSSSTEQNPYVSYAEEGKYDVHLTVKNESGEEAVKYESKYIRVRNPNGFPVASFIHSCGTYIIEGNSINFLDLSANATSREWKFPGGAPATSTDKHPSITYNDEGTYPVTLIASNEYGSDTLTVTDCIIVQKPVGIEEFFSKNFHVYPNPATTELNISYLPTSEKVFIQIMDNTGRVIEQSEFEGSAREQKLRLDLSNYQKGVYYIRFRDPGSSVVQKFIVH